MPRLPRIAKYGVKAVAGLAANLALLTVWVDVAGMPAWAAIIPNYVLLSVAAYVVANRWIWPDGVSPTTLRGHAEQFGGMQAADFTGKAANYVFYLVLIPYADYRVAWIIGSVLTFAVTFALNHVWWTRDSRPA